MSEWIKKLIGMHTCFNCETLINKKEIYNVDVDTAEGPLHLKLCQKCADDFDDLMKELEEVLAERNNTF